MYNPLSSDATEFIDHHEILSSIDYARANASNLPLLRSIIEKGEKMQGLTHREALTLLESEEPEIIAAIQ